MNVTPAATPVLPEDVEALMRQLKMPYARALAPELIATARAQRWEPVEVIRALFVEEEVTGRARSMLAMRRRAAGFPTGKTFDTWDESISSIPAPMQQALSTLEWVSSPVRCSNPRRGRAKTTPPEQDCEQYAAA